MYHSYKNGYSVLPKLNKLGNSVVFQGTGWDIDRFEQEKIDALKHQQCFLEHNITPEIYEAVNNFIVNSQYWFPTPPLTFSNLAMQCQEDLAIHRMDDSKDWLAAAHICFPSGWLPEEKIGKSFEEIHSPIPGMNLKTSRKLVETMIYSGPFDRYVWGVIFEDRINRHPRFPKKLFDINNPVLYVTIERQVIVGFPEHKAALFVIRQFLIKESDIDKPALLKSLEGMTPEQITYKGIESSYSSLLSHLRC